MILQKKTINNVPTLVPLTADTGSGVPVGTIIGQYKKVNMSGYLYLDGSTFDQTLYPALYAYLGTNVLPDYREFVLVGAEQNTTSATIADHDVFTQGQEKDDRIQNHDHGIPVDQSSGSAQSVHAVIANANLEIAYTGPVHAARQGTTTRTKEKAVFWYIKATTGIIESEATEMLNVINENNSYSLDEVATGKTWIDGKPIYRKSGYISSSINLEGAHYVIDAILNGSYIDNLISEGGSAVAEGNRLSIGGYTSTNSSSEYRLSIGVMPYGLCLLSTNQSFLVSKVAWWVEYTKA